MLSSLSLGPILSFAILVGVIIAIHELGHFLVGLAFRTKIAEFSVGFGPSLTEKTYKGITFKLAWLPLGGFVRFLSTKENEEASPEQEHWEFYDLKAPWVRFLISFAGPLFNFVFSFCLFFFLYQIGLDRTEASLEVLKNHYAETIGLESGDIILKIGQHSIQGFEEIPLVLANLPLGTSSFTVKRCHQTCEEINLPFEKQKEFSHRFLNSTSKKIGVLPYTFSNYLWVNNDENFQNLIETGDQIIKINGKRLNETKYWKKQINAGEKKVQLTLKRHPGLISKLQLMKKTSEQNKEWLTSDSHEVTIEISQTQIPSLLNLSDLSKKVFYYEPIDEPLRPIEILIDQKSYPTDDLIDLQIFLSEILEKKIYQKQTITLVTRSLKSNEKKEIAISEESADKFYFSGYWLSEIPNRVLTKSRSVRQSIQFSYWEIKTKIFGFAELIRELILGRKKVKDHIGGPAAIAKLSSDAYKQGLRVFLSLMALLSLNIGFLNLLPFPALDGGKLLQNIIEMITGSSKIVQYEGYFNFVGFLILFVFMIYIFYQDLVRIFFSG
jgi:regulator of sigma E protease